MRYVRLVLISLIVFGLLFTAMSLLFPSHVRISRATDITTSKDSLLLQLSEPKNMMKWLPVKDGEEGELYIKSKSDSSVIVTSDLIGNKTREMGWNIYDTPVPGTYTVQWYVDIHLRWYPWEKFSALLLDKRFGPVMEKGLEKLKASLGK